jgi:hypothetical protein
LRSPQNGGLNNYLLAEAMNPPVRKGWWNPTLWLPVFVPAVFVSTLQGLMATRMRQ